MSRRKTAKADSLELLLDTICNTFGGVLFIAILVVILLQITGGEAAQQPGTAPVSPETFRELGTRLKQLTSEIGSYQEVLESQRRMTQQFAPEKVRELITSRNQKSREEDLQRKVRDELLVANANQKILVQNAKTEASNLQTELRKLREESEALRVRLEQERASRAKQIRLPVLHSSALKHEVALIVRYGRVYVWHRYDKFGHRQGLNEDEFVVVGEDKGQLLTRPKPTAGVLLEKRGASKDSLRQRLKVFSPSTSYFGVVVRPDSFDNFAVLRECMVELGFEYRLFPQEEGMAVVDRGGSDSQVQ